MQRARLRRRRSSLAILTFLLVLYESAQEGQANGKERDDLKAVTSERLLQGTDDPAAWLMYGGNYASWRFSPLQDIHRQNIKNLSLAWMFQTGVPGQLEASPIVADGILYLTAAYNQLFALDAASGAPLWNYHYPLPPDVRICCGPANRGVAIADDKVFMGTLDAHLVALHRKTGAILWEMTVGEYVNGYSITAAPLVVKDKVIIGVAGGDYGVRGYIDAYDVATGERKWRRYTIPSAGEKGSETWADDSWKTGGGGAWVTGSYDPKQNVLFWATGNPSPVWNGDVRVGDNLYTDSVLALDPDSGELRWHFQFSPHDVWDYDGNTDLFLIDVKRGDRSVKALAQPNRNGYLYLLDRATGKYLYGSQYVHKLNWAKGLDENGRPIVDPRYTPTSEAKNYICPGSVGGKNGSHTAAYSPLTKYLYIPVTENCWRMQKAEAIFIQGMPFWSGGPRETQKGRSSYGHLSAIDPTTGAVVWSYTDAHPLRGGTLALGGGLIVTGNQTGYALAFDDTTGALLWKFQTGSAVYGQPITYRTGNRQYIAIPSGGRGRASRLVGEPPLMTKGSALLVFALPKE